MSKCENIEEAWVCEPFPPELCILCVICEEPIPVISISDAYPRICPECKKRLREILYEKKGE